jgi:putative Mn2+ efflux pump MntP
MWSVLLIGLGLAMDAFAVSVSSGISIPGLKAFYAIRASLAFGVFQFIMPLAGWYLGKTFAAYIAAWDHWIAFVLLVFIGGKTVAEALMEAAGQGGKTAGRPGEGPEPPETRLPAAGGAASGEKTDTGDIRDLRTLLSLALATSIDALAVGVSFSVLGRGIWDSAALIGGVTAAVCLGGFEAGRRVGSFLRKWSRIAGGLILTGLGIKILLEHLLRAG